MYSKAYIIALKHGHLSLKPQPQYQAPHEAIPVWLPSNAKLRGNIHAPSGNAIASAPARFNNNHALPIMGTTWLRRGLQSSAEHTEGQPPRKSNWKRNSRERLLVRSYRRYSNPWPLVFSLNRCSLKGTRRLYFLASFAVILLPVVSVYHIV